MIRGPGIAPGTKTDAVALTIDLAPTILDMAGVPRPEYMDGKSLLPFIRVRRIGNKHASFKSPQSQGWVRSQPSHLPGQAARTYKRTCYKIFQLRP